MSNSKFKTGRVSDVSYIYGTVSFFNVNLSVFAFQTDGILIDTVAEKLVDGLMSFIKNEPIDKVFITHAHEDHTGGAHYIQQETDLPIFMHPQYINREQKKADYPLYRKIFWGKRKPFQAYVAPESFSSKQHDWRAIYTPGHASDHYAYLNQSTGQLFSGDLYVHPQTKLILKDESIPTTIQSIKHILTYDFEEMFCCHAGYLQNGRQAFQRKLDYLQDLEGKVLQLYHKGQTPQAIRKELFPKTYPIQYFSLGEWGTQHVITSIITHKL